MLYTLAASRRVMVESEGTKAGVLTDGLGAPHCGGLHQECPSHLPHQDADDQAGTGQGPCHAERELGPLPAQVQKEEHKAEKAADQGWEPLVGEVDVEELSGW
jgi:hypothetical protein